MISANDEAECNIISDKMSQTHLYFETSTSKYLLILHLWPTIKPCKLVKQIPVGYNGYYAAL